MVTEENGEVNWTVTADNQSMPSVSLGQEEEEKRRAMEIEKFFQVKDHCKLIEAGRVFRVLERQAESLARSEQWHSANGSALRQELLKRE